MKLFVRCLALWLLLNICHQIRGEEVCATAGECANPDVEGASDADSNEAPAEQAVLGEKEDESCPSRPFVIQCAGRFLDVNQNGLLERAELQSAIDALPWYSRGIISILGSVDKMMKKCDLDRDGAISIDYDMKNNGETCLATCFKRLAFKKAFFPECTPESLQ